MERDDFIIGEDDPVLVTGATGFVGPKVVESLMDLGLRNLRCLVRPTRGRATMEGVANRHTDARFELIQGNLLSQEDCAAATRGAAVIFHLAAGRERKSFPDAFLNSVVTTRNLLEASLQHGSVKRFVNVSSFVVYTNMHKRGGRLLDESSLVEDRPELRWDPYCFAKVKQEEIVKEYGRGHGIPYVIVRPGYVYGPGRRGITGRVGIDTFGVFLHLGGSNRLPLTYVDNCADAIAIAGLKKGIDGQVFNVVDDDLPSSRQFLRLYKQNVRQFRSFNIPPFASYVLCTLWERYSLWSGQLEPVINRRAWHAYWKQTEYSNEKLKRLGWAPKVATADGLHRYFESCRNGERNA